jgi:uncharacterized protein YjlB
MTPAVTRVVEPVRYVFADDGLIPNNALPLLLYPAAIARESNNAPTAIAALMASRGWDGIWINGIYDYLHYHATVHEALAVAQGRARVRFGGDSGAELVLAAGDVAVLPAGTGHECVQASDDFVVVGAYPPGSRMEITRPTAAARVAAMNTIPEVPLPRTDPLYGADGPLVRIWSDGSPPAEGVSPELVRP